MRMAVLDGSAVVNVIEVDPKAEFDPGEGLTLMASKVAGPGWQLVDGKLQPPPAPPPSVPDTISMRQARLAMLGAGLLDQVETALDALPEPQRSAARIEWEYATQLQRNHPLVVALGSGLGLNEQQLDGLFIQAAAIA